MIFQCFMAKIGLPYTLFFFYSVAHSLSSFRKGFFMGNVLRRITLMIYCHCKKPSGFVAIQFERRHRHCKECNDEAIQQNSLSSSKITNKKQGNFEVILLFLNTKLCKLRLSVYAYLFSVTSVGFKFHHAVDCCKQCIV